ncbi:hypothetical protein WAI453_009927 [Rhynchosporium graminicola]
MTRALLNDSCKDVLTALSKCEILLDKYHQPGLVSGCTDLQDECDALWAYIVAHKRQLPCLLAFLMAYKAFRLKGLPSIKNISRMSNLWIRQFGMSPKDLLSKVMDDKSATLSGNFPVEIHKDHREMTRFDKRDDNGYR